MFRRCNSFRLAILARPRVAGGARSERACGCSNGVNVCDTTTIGAAAGAARWRSRSKCRLQRCWRLAVWAMLRLSTGDALLLAGAHALLGDGLHWPPAAGCRSGAHTRQCQRSCRERGRSRRHVCRLDFLAGSLASLSPSCRIWRMGFRLALGVVDLPVSRWHVVRRFTANIVGHALAVAIKCIAG